MDHSSLPNYRLPLPSPSAAPQPRPASRDQVEQLLGPPTEHQAWGPEVAQFPLRWWNGGRNIVPADREWNRWSDPANPERWAAVVYTNWLKKQAVYGELKKGF